MEDDSKTTAETPEVQDIKVEGASEELDNNANAEANGGEDTDATEVKVEIEEKDELSLIKAELEGAKTRAAEATEQYLRLMAEFDNFRKRSRRETEALQEFASEKVLTVLLPVLDDFERTLTVMEKTDNMTSIQDGINLVHDKLQRVLQKEGLNRINAKDEEFDSELHEAIHSIEAPEEDKKGKVLEEVEKGYRLKDKVIRYSKVIVGE